MRRMKSSASLLGAIPVLVGFLGCGDATADREVVDAPAAEAPAATPAAAPASARTPADTALLDPNVATREELVTVAHIAEPVAAAIVAGRPYEDMLAVDRVLAPHLSEQEREEAYARMWKPLDLNSASREEMLLIPGVGERLQHEFEEYRPYRAMAQFRREIGKYVDDGEVARLERYVTVR